MIDKTGFKYSLAAIILGISLLVAGSLWFGGDRPEARPGLRDAAQSQPEAGPQLLPVVSAADLRKRINAAAVMEYPELMRLALALKDPGEQSELVAELIRRWMNADMVAFSAFLDEIEILGGSVWKRFAPALMAALPDVKEDRVDGFLLREITERVILNAAETDSQAALAWAREWLKGTTLDSALAGIASELVNVDPEGAMALVSEIKAMSNRLEAAVGVGLVLGERHPDQGLAWAAAFTRETDRAFAMSGVLTGLAAGDTNRAAMEYSQLVQAMKERYRQQVLADRAAAGTTVDEEYEGLSLEEIRKAELARPNPNLIYLEKAAYSIGAAMARENPQQALEWAKSLDIYQGGVAATEAVFEEWASSEPQDAYQSFLQESGRRPELAERVFGAWASSNPAAASTAALELSPGLERDHAVEGVARGWMDFGASPERIARWSDDLSSTSEKDRVRALVASEAAFDNPVFAWQQVEQIQNQGKRSALFQEVFPSLVENNPQMARQALANIHLSEVEMEYFQSMLSK